MLIIKFTANIRTKSILPNFFDKILSIFIKKPQKNKAADKESTTLYIKLLANYFVNSAASRYAALFATPSHMRASAAA